MDHAGAVRRIQEKKGHPEKGSPATAWGYRTEIPAQT